MTGDEQLLHAPLAVEQIEHQHFGTNFIRTAVCELRFPTLHEIDNDKPPLRFAHVLRKEYPAHAVASGVNLTAAALARNKTHVFTSRNALWSINLSTQALSLETSRYDSFRDFEARIGQLIEASLSFIDTDFFTRIGIRYVNVLPYERSTVAEWVNPSLVANLAAGLYGDCTEYSQSVRGTTEVGGYLFQHGIGQGKNASTTPGYGLDFDFYAENVEVKSAMSIIAALHKREYEMFMWSLGDRAKAHLKSAEVRHA